ncbi:MAG: DUF2993 domain-containing protein [Cyanobacteria bacterium J06634_6]
MDNAVTNSDGSVDAKKGGSRFISKLLPPAVKLWLRSQVESVEQLQIDLSGRDRQIITGYLPGVSVSAQRVTYQGIQISDVQLSAKDIRINVGQVVRGKPLRLLKAFPVIGTVLLSCEDLDASLGSPLLAEGLNGFWRSLVSRPDVADAVCDRYGKLPLASDMMLARPTVQIGVHRLALSFYPATAAETARSPIVLSSVLSVVDGRFLKLTDPRWLDGVEQISQPAAGIPIESLEGYQWDLGKDTQLSQLTIQPSQLLCEGEITVLP